MVNEYKPEYGYKPQTIEHVTAGDHYRAEQPSKKNKIKEHYKRFWWVHLIMWIFGTILVTCLLMFVGLPNIAQDGLDKAELLMVSQVVSDPSPKSVHLNQTTKSISHSPFAPYLGEFRAALFLESTMPDIVPFGFLTIPGVKATKEVLINVDQTMDIQDMEQFIAYNTLFSQEKEFRLAMRGRCSLKQPGLPTVYVDFNKVIMMPGLNRLQGVQVRDISLAKIGSTFPDGSNMRGNLFIPNPTNSSITLGQVVQNLFVDGKPIGNTTIQNMVLVPGDNLIPMTSISDQAAVTALVTGKYKTGIFPVEARTASVIYNFQHLPYFEAAMGKTPVMTTLDVAAAMKRDLGLDLALMANTLAGGTTAPKGTTTLPKTTTPATGGAAAGTAPKATVPKAVTPPAGGAVAPAAGGAAAAAPAVPKAPVAGGAAAPAAGGAAVAPAAAPVPANPPKRV